ncbi:MAG: aldehyde-activating protein [Alphaproteobacteria bacterium]|nr:MAG: aldehyde-activating protein [Alphaproteobacteria bacterium]
MSDWKLPWSASCQCGQVKMRITAPPMVSMACHCRSCQRLTGGAYSLTLLIPAEGFAVVEGEPVIGGMHRAELAHHFCPHCKNWLFTRPQGMPFVNFRPTMLNDASWVQPYAESCIEDRLPGAITGAKYSFEGFPPPEKYGELMAGYAREGAKPQ